MAETKTCRLDLKNYHISEKTGFLLENVLEKLPEYFEAWNHFSSSPVFCALIENHELRQELDQMPVLDHTRLHGHRQLRLARLQLSMLVAGYVWQNGDKGVPKKLPKCLAVPYWEVSRVLEMQPALSHGDMVLSNWRFHDEGQEGLSTLNNIQIFYSLPGGEEGNWFLKAGVGVELSFSSALKPLINSIEAAEDGDDVALECSLNELAASLRETKSAFAMSHEGLNADIFYNKTRPFLAGWGGKASPLPDGLVYEGVDENPKQIDGASGGQSSTLQCIDAALGVQHAPEKKAFFTKMLKHMPAPHRKFVLDIRERTKILEFVNSTPSNTLKTAYRNCIQALVDIRSYHIQLVTKYVVNPHREKKTEDLKGKREPPTMADGSNIIPFLQSSRDASKENSVLL